LTAVPVSAGEAIQPVNDSKRRDPNRFELDDGVVVNVAGVRHRESCPLHASMPPASIYGSAKPPRAIPATPAPIRTDRAAQGGHRHGFVIEEAGGVNHIGANAEDNPTLRSTEYGDLVYDRVAWRLEDGNATGAR
jgi:hypothetical protein